MGHSIVDFGAIFPLQGQPSRQHHRHSSFVFPYILLCACASVQELGYDSWDIWRLLRLFFCHPHFVVVSFGDKYCGKLDMSCSDSELQKFLWPFCPVPSFFGGPYLVER